MKNYLKFLSFLLFFAIFSTNAFSADDRALPAPPSLQIVNEKNNTQNLEQKQNTQNTQDKNAPKNDIAAQMAQNKAQKAENTPQDSIESKNQAQDLNQNEEQNLASTPAMQRRIRNPFVPNITPKESGQVSMPPDLSLFRRAELQLPSTARRIRKITIEFQNLNGSITSVEQELNGDVDWHFPLVLSQEVAIKELQVQQFQNFTLGDIFELSTNERSIEIYSPSEIIRDFILANPARLVLDFPNPSRADARERRDIGLPIFTQAMLESHLDFYRVIIVLDGQYNYKISTATSPSGRQGYIIDFE